MTRVLLVSQEFCGPLFSGNGVYARSLARALVSPGGAATALLVLSGVRDSGAEVEETGGGSWQVLPVPLPAASWSRLDAGSGANGWSALAAGAGSVAAAVAEFAPDVALLVDWHGANAFAAAVAAAPALSSVRTVYLCFRVYAASAAFAREAAFYRAAERRAVRCSDSVVALCRADAASLLALAVGVDPLSRASFDGKSGICAGEAYSAEPSTLALALPEAVDCHFKRLFVLLPPLRGDISSLALAAAEEPESAARSLLVCCVRLSPEKGAHRFAAVAEAVVADMVAAAGASPPLRPPLRPLLCGSAGDADYAALVRARMRALDSHIAAPPVTPFTGDSSEASTGGDAVGTVVERFLGPADMAVLFRHAALNSHPPDADAYGMTVVEAASFGAVTVLQGAMPPPAGSPLPKLAFTRVVPSLRGLLEVTPSSPMCGSLAAMSADDAAAILAYSAFPPVGACDLLGDPQPLATFVSDESARGGIGTPAGAVELTAGADDDDGGPAVLAADWMACDGEGAAGAAAAARLAADLLAVTASPAALSIVAARARRRALEWTEAGTASALCALVAAARQTPLLHEAHH